MSSADEWQEPRQRAVEQLLVAVAVVFVAMRVNLPHGHLLTGGDVLAILLAPVWLPSLRRHAGAWLLMLLGVAALAAGLLLTYFSSRDHPTSSQALLANNALLVGLLVSLGFLVWARERLGDSALLTLYGLGLVLGVDRGSDLYASGWWKFGYSLGVAVLLLGLAYRRRGWELVTLCLLALASSASDSRSSFSILLLTAALVAWQLRPKGTGLLRASAVRGVLGLAAAGALIYNIGTMLILNGVLGEVTRQRSLGQIDASGSLLLGGRPEVAATVALMRQHPLGFGSGVSASFSDLEVAKQGMAAVNYDPNNGYVEHYMFGTSYELHSVAGDAWARYGLVGLALVLVIALLVLRWLGLAVSAGTGSAVTVFLAVETLWDVAFSPVYASMPVLVVAVAVVLSRRSTAPDQDQRDERAGSPQELLPAP